MIAIIKPRPIDDTRWWEHYTKPVLEFVASHDSVSWKDLRTFVKSRHIPTKLVPDMVAFLDLSRHIHQDGNQWRFGPPPGIE